MVKREHTVLQLPGPVEPVRLEQAYQAAQARFKRLTARGPLRFYRNDLLADARRAYQVLRRGPATVRPAEWGGVGKGPVKSSIGTGSILSGKQEVVRGREVGHGREGKNGDRQGGRMVLPEGRSKREQGLVEDEFCREVIYRLEGDLIRFDSRRELLAWAEKMAVGKFRANMLMAQIVEAVRQDKLYESPAKRGGNNKGQENGRRWVIKGLIAAGVLGVAAVVDWLIIRYLGRG